MALQQSVQLRHWELKWTRTFFLRLLIQTVFLTGFLDLHRGNLLNITRNMLTLLRNKMRNHSQRTLHLLLSKTTHQRRVILLTPKLHLKHSLTGVDILVDEWKTRLYICLVSARWCWLAVMSCGARVCVSFGSGAGFLPRVITTCIYPFVSWHLGIPYFTTIDLWRPVFAANALT